MGNGISFRLSLVLRQDNTRNVGAWDTTDGNALQLHNQEAQERESHGDKSNEGRRELGTCDLKSSS